MADAHGKKRGRPRITDSERKRRKIVRKKSYEQSRVYLGNEIDRWNVIKHNHSLQNDREVATFLIDRFHEHMNIEPGPSRLIEETRQKKIQTVSTCTPASLHRVPPPDSSTENNMHTVMYETKNDDQIAMAKAYISQEDALKDKNIRHFTPDSRAKVGISDQNLDNGSDETSIVDAGGTNTYIASCNDDTDVEDPELAEIEKIAFADDDDKIIPFREDNVKGNDVSNNVKSTRLRSQGYRPNYAAMVWTNSSTSEDSASDYEHYDNIDDEVLTNESDSSIEVRKVKGKGQKHMNGFDEEYIPSENESVSGTSDDHDDNDDGKGNPSSNEGEVQIVKVKKKQSNKPAKIKKNWVKINLEEHADKYCIENIESFERQHRNKDDAGIKSFSCLVCKHFKCTEKTALSNHIEEHVNKVLECSKCDYIAAHWRELSQHCQDSGHFEANFVCDLCGMTFSSPPKRQSHRALIHGIPVHKCIFCHEMFPSKSLRKTHMRTSHPDDCQYCEHCTNCRPGLNPKMFQMHLESCRSTVHCEICGMEMKKNVLSTHLRRVHNNIRRFQCKLCPYAAKDRGPLKRHMLAHKNEHPHQCDVCSFSCVQASQLTSHMRTHSGEKPFKCTQCKYAAAWNVQLKDHLKVHELDTAVMCKQCDVLFKNNTALKIHVKKNH